MSQKSELGRLSAGERLLVDRRRREESQQEAADRYDVSLFLYGQWERDDVPGPRVIGIHTGELLDHERCLLYRRRVGVTQAWVADGLKRSRWWVNLMERGLESCDELLWYWEA